MLIALYGYGMRYHDKSVAKLAALLGVYIVVGAIPIFAKDFPSFPRIACLTMATLVIILQVAHYCLQYWEFGRNSFIERRLWNWTEQSYAGITYVGPVVGKVWFRKFAQFVDPKLIGQFIEIRSGNDSRALALPVRRKEFLVDLHKHLPEEVFYF
jgi:hypothetical protein